MVDIGFLLFVQYFLHMKCVNTISSVSTFSRGVNLDVYSGLQDLFHCSWVNTADTCDKFVLYLISKSDQCVVLSQKQVHVKMV